jgi:hypothetical protein
MMRKITVLATIFRASVIMIKSSKPGGPCDPVVEVGKIVRQNTQPGFVLLLESVARIGPSQSKTFANLAQSVTP